MYDFLVFIGRFQPFHVAHLAVIREALRQAREVIVLVGSAGQSRNLRNPFTVDERMAMIIDPMLATGGSLIATIDMLKRNGCKHVRALVLVAAPEGIKAVQGAHPDVDVYTAAVDSHLNEIGYIIPGLGDAGDKIFGTK